MAVLTVYSKASDGWVMGRDADYATSRLLEAASTRTNTADYLVTSNRWNTTNNRYEPARSFLYFDTSALGAGATIISAVLSIYGSATAQAETNAGHSDICLYKGTQGEPLVIGHYVSYEATLLTDGTYSWQYPLATDAYTEATLNAAGRDAINKTGTTKFCLRAKGDVDALTPTGDNWETPWANEKGAGYMFKLVITYTPAVVGRSRGYIIG